jgi:L-seryl-tRNA(Ser) seleniumtransferase
MNNLSYKSLLSSLPAVHKIQKLPEVQNMISRLGNSLVLSKIREVQKELRETLISENKFYKIDIDIFLSKLRNKVSEVDNDLLRPVFNLTGTVIHTNFGRSILPLKAIQEVKLISENPSNLEYDVLKTKRGNRDDHINDMLCEITGAEACTIVNNNAAAVILVLNSLAKRKEVLVSRGELIEIGGSFRLPEIMTSANCKLKEVGTTNRTHIEDFESEIKKQTGLILKS